MPLRVRCVRILRMVIKSLQFTVYSLRFTVMKKSLNILALASLAMSWLTACSPDSYEGPAAGALPVAANYADHISISIDPEERFAYLRFSSAPGITPMWVLDGDTYSSDFTFKKFYTHPGMHDVEFRVKNANGISADVVKRQFEMIIAEPKWVAVDSPDNLWNAANDSYSWTYLDDDMATSRPAPTVTKSNRSYSFTLPQATTKRQQAMMTYKTDLTIEDVDQEYDFIALGESSKSFTGRVLLYDHTDANNLVFDEEMKLEAGKTVRFFVRQSTATAPITGGSGRRAKRLDLRFDFGTNPANTDIVIKDIIIQKHIKKS